MLDFIEELFKNEQLMKSKNLINALLYHADIYRNPKSSPAAKAQAMEQIKIIGQGRLPPKKTTRVKTRAEAGPRVIKAPPASTGPAGDKSGGAMPSTGKPVLSARSTHGPNVDQRIQPKYHPVYKHYNITPETWNALPNEHKQHTFNFHNEVVAGKHPEYAHVQKLVQEHMKKSLEKVLGNLKVIKEEFRKSSYGPKKAGLYNPADNMKRKASRTGDIVPAGPNVGVRAFSTKPGQLSAKQAAAAAEKKKKKLSGPVKVYSPEEIKALETQRKLNKPS